MKSLLEAYQVLGLPPGTSGRLVKRAYRGLVKQWHPDQFANRPSLRTEAEERIKQINVAFELIQSQGELVALALRAQQTSRTAHRSHPAQATPAPKSKPQPEPTAPPLNRRPTSHATTAQPQSATARRAKAPFLAIFGASLAIGIVAALLLPRGDQPQNTASSTTPPTIVATGSPREPALQSFAPIAVPERVAAASITGNSALSGSSTFASFSGKSDRETVSIHSMPGPGASAPNLGSTPTKSIVPSPPLESSANATPLDTTSLPKSAPEFTVGLTALSKNQNERQKEREELLAAEVAQAVDVDLGKKYYSIGSSYLTATPANYEEGVKYLLLAAERGNSDAQKKLGFLYAAGTGVPKDAALAQEWLRKSAQNGDASAGLAGIVIGLTKTNASAAGGIEADRDANSSHGGD